MGSRDVDRKNRFEVARKLSSRDARAAADVQSSPPALWKMLEEELRPLLQRGDVVEGLGHVVERLRIA